MNYKNCIKIFNKENQNLVLFLNLDLELFKEATKEIQNHQNQYYQKLVLLGKMNSKLYITLFNKKNKKPVLFKNIDLELYKEVK